MSKELEALETLKRCEWHCSKEWKENYPIVEKSLKALEVIKEKGVNIYILLLSEDVEDYNQYAHQRTLTQEEYELLKEVLL